MRTLLTSATATLCMLAASAQADAQTIKLPPNHSIQQSTSGAPNLLRTDLDGDGKADLFCVAEDAEGVGYFVAITSTRGRMESGKLPACCGSMEKTKPGTLRIASKGMRGFSYYTFRWDAPAKDFRLIGYDTESFGNAANDGSGSSSLNLLTGDFVAAFNSYDEKKETLVALPKVRKKVKVDRRIHLQKFDEESEAWVANLAYQHFPKAVQ